MKTLELLNNENDSFYLHDVVNRASVILETAWIHSEIFTQMCILLYSVRCELFDYISVLGHLTEFVLSFRGTSTEQTFNRKSLTLR